MALNSREKVMLTFPVLLGGVLSFYNWVHEPLFARKAEVETRFVQVKTDLTKDRAKLSKEGELPVRQSAVTAEEQTIDSWVPGKNSAALLVWYLSQAELHSGVQIRGITIGDLKQLTLNGQDGKGESKAGAAAKPSGGSGSAAAQAKTGTAEALDPATGGAASGAARPLLNVITIDLKVDGRFAEQLLFAQSMEQAPLFLNTDAITLTRQDPVGSDKVSKLLADGNAFLAQQLLGSSPVVGGTYQLNLYFKSGKAGPGTNTMQFGEGTGRTDPFVMNQVSDFVQTLQQIYPPQEAQHNGREPGTRNTPPSFRGAPSGQMG